MTMTMTHSNEVSTHVNLALRTRMEKREVFVTPKKKNLVILKNLLKQVEFSEWRKCSTTLQRLSFFTCLLTI